MSKFIANKISLMSNENGEVIVCLASTQRTRSAARATFNEMKNSQRELSVEIKPYNNPRSIKQNAMLWALIEKIAKEECGYSRKTETIEVYCDLLEEANCAYSWVLAKDRETLRGAFRAVRQYGTREVVDKDGNNIELNLYKCYIGSSKFTTAEMKELIECALDRCASLGIIDSETELIRREYGNL